MKHHIYSIITLAIFSIFAIGSVDTKDESAGSESSASSAKTCDLVQNNLMEFFVEFHANPDAKPSDKEVMTRRTQEIFDAAKTIRSEVEIPFDVSDLSENERKQKQGEIMDLYLKYAKEHYPQYQGKTGKEIVDWCKQNPK